MFAGLLMPLLFGAGSIAANTIAANQRGRAQADAMSAERLRQRRFDEESYALNNMARDRFEGFGEQQGERSSTLADLYRSVLDQPESRPVAALPASSSNIVNDAAARSAASARGDAEDMADRRAAFNSFGDLFGGIQREQGTDSRMLNMVNSFRRGSQNVLPLELQAALEKGQGWNMLGDLLNLGSGLTLQRGLLTPLSGGAWWNPGRG